MRDYEYKRLGTVSLLAAIDLLTGEAIPLVSESHKSSDFVTFLKLIDNRYPAGDKIRIILDNHSAHTSKETQKYLNTVPERFEFVFTPTHGSWLNMVEGFFSKMTRQMLTGIRVDSKEELIERIYKYFNEVNAVPVPYKWKHKMWQKTAHGQLRHVTGARETDIWAVTVNWTLPAHKIPFHVRHPTIVLFVRYLSFPGAPSHLQIALNIIFNLDHQ